MNKITLQELTPEIYYKQSRDFQFIGRLFDVVLNSVKTNTENLYNLPLNDYTDEKLIDLMSLTLGFKSKHNYNVKQLTALCSAFCTIIKNKGNITSILLAINTLLNAEGIQDEATYNFEDNCTVLNLYIPSELSDLNLLRDLLDYILPAGMSCNIIRQSHTSIDDATTSITNNSKITVFGSKPIDSWNLSVIPQIEDENDPRGYAAAGSTPGLLANSEVLQIPGTTEEEE